MSNIVAQINITVDDAGGVQVQGAIDNKMFAYGLLEVARDAINEHVAAASRRIQPASASERLALAGLAGK